MRGRTIKSCIPQKIKALQELGVKLREWIFFLEREPRERKVQTY